MLGFLRVVEGSNSRTLSPHDNTQKTHFSFICECSNKSVIPIPYYLVIEEPSPAFLLYYQRHLAIGSIIIWMNIFSMKSGMLSKDFALCNHCTKLMMENIIIS